MIRNYLTETDLKGLIPNLDSLLFVDQDNWDLQKSDAEIDVMNDFINSKYRAVFLRNDLSLRASGLISADEYTDSSDEDVITRQRWIVDVTTFTGATKTLTLQGRDDDADSWEDVTDISVTAAEQSSAVISKFFKYYRIFSDVPDGTLNFVSGLTETIYDKLYLFKWASKIYWSLFTSGESEFKLKYDMMNDMYEEARRTALIYYDSDSSGDVTTDEGVSSNQFQMLQ